MEIGGGGGVTFAYPPIQSSRAPGEKSSDQAQHSCSKPQIFVKPVCGKERNGRKGCLESWPRIKLEEEVEKNSALKWR